MTGLRLAVRKKTPSWHLFMASMALGFLDLLYDDWSEAGGEKEDAFLAPLHGVHGARFPLVLNNSLALGLSPVIHHHEGSLQVSEHGECSVQELIGHPGTQVLDPQRRLVRSKLDLEISVADHFAVK